MFDDFKQLKAKVNDTEINFKIRNIHKSCENAILFLHGFPQTHAMWAGIADQFADDYPCLLYTSPSPRDNRVSRMPSSA